MIDSWFSPGLPPGWGGVGRTWLKREFKLAQGRSTRIISTIKWIQTSRLSIHNSLSGGVGRTWLTTAMQAVVWFDGLGPP